MQIGTTAMGRKPTPRWRRPTSTDGRKLAPHYFAGPAPSGSVASSWLQRWSPAIFRRMQRDDRQWNLARTPSGTLRFVATGTVLASYRQRSRLISSGRFAVRHRALRSSDGRGRVLPSDGHPGGRRRIDGRVPEVRRDHVPGPLIRLARPHGDPHRMPHVHARGPGYAQCPTQTGSGGSRRD